MSTSLLKKLSFAAILAAGSCVWALPDGVQLNDDGSFRIGEAGFKIQTWTAGWKCRFNGNWNNRKIQREAGNFQLEGKLNINSVSGTVKETLRSSGKDKFSLDCSVDFPSPVQIMAMHAAMEIPDTLREFSADGKTVKFPAEYREQCIFNRSIRTFSILLAGGRLLTVSGSPLRTVIQDNRKFGSPTFSIRFLFTPDKGRLTKSSLSLRFELRPAVSQIVDIRREANRSFSDGSPDSTLPGWTGQGKENDLRMIRPGEITQETLRFRIIDPSGNGKRGAVVLGKSVQSGLKQSVTLELPSDTVAGAVNLLHAAAWQPSGNGTVGEVLVTFADGSRQSFEVRARRDIGNWWGRDSLPNAQISWQGKNGKAQVGLYASGFPLRRNDPRSIRLTVTDNKMLWLIPAVTLTDLPVRFHNTGKKEMKITAGKNWIPLQFNGETVKGSALDFSFLQDAPAGKYGFIQAGKDGKLTFENAPDKRIRFYGVNLCFNANFLDKATVDRMADEFVRQGYNLVRIHHHDSAMLDKNAPDSLTLDPEQLDRLDYLFYRMKENGIYITTDFNTNRNFKPGDLIPESGGMKQLAPLSKAARNNWKEFVRRWMTHKNPYTGLTWGEDPALFCVNLINEDTLPFQWNINPQTAQIYIERFKTWAEANGYAGAQATEAGRPFRKFLQELQQNSHREQIRFIREQLNMKTLLTSLNYINEAPLTLLRNEFDVVDNHLYFDHPTSLEKPWQAPFGYAQLCAIEQYATLPRDLMPTRIFGKPFLVTEFNYCFPNRHRAEGGPLIGAYSALQNWNGLCRFAWSHGKQKIINPQHPAEGFDAVNDPFARLSDRIAILMFRRGDIKAAKRKFVWQVNREIFDTDESFDFPADYQKLGLISQIGSAPSDSLPAGNVIGLSKKSKYPESLVHADIKNSWERLIRHKIAVSDTEELRLDPKSKTFTVTSPRSESVTLPGGDLQAGIFGVKGATCFQTAAAMSLDGKPLPESSDILVIHLTNLTNTDAHFGDQEMKVLKHRGKLPLLIYRGTAEAEFATGHSYRVDALSPDGKLLGQVAGKRRNGKFYFLLDPGHFPQGVMAYRLSR